LGIKYTARKLASSEKYSTIINKAISKNKEGLVKRC
jgi:hypothetical protein